MIATRVRRALTMSAPAADGRPAYLSAASGLVRVGELLYVVADDELALGVFPAEGDAPGAWLTALAGDLPLEPKARKKRKADFEALVALPPCDAHPNGALLALPSGSRPNRVVAALFALDSRGAAPAPARAIDCSAWYAALVERFPKLNLEGAVVVDGQLRLFHRGNRGHEHRGASACLCFEYGSIARELDAGRVAAHAMLRVDAIDLGAIDGVPLAISDACALREGRVAFCAVAEDTDDPYEDGAFKGAAIGILDAHGAIAALERIDAPAKIEGIEARESAGALELLLVTDADDVARPGLLLEAHFALPCA